MNTKSLSKISRNPIKLKAIDLFSGAGGLTLGLVHAGGEPIAAVDHDLDSTVTYTNMFPACKNVFHGDIEKWSPDITEDIDIIIGGPPCQGFSLARGQRFLNDPRNTLYREFLRIVDRLRPKWIVIENVPGITNIGGGIILEQIYEEFAAIGYWLDHRIINMADYGVPQTRKRTVFVGSRITKQFAWPEPSHQKGGYVTIKDALDDLPWELGRYFSHRANSQMRGPRNREVHKDPSFTLRVRGDEFAFCKRPAKGAFAPNLLPAADLAYHPLTSSYQKLMRRKSPNGVPSQKIPEATKPKKKFKETRRLAVREMARLQSFPDWFQFSGSPYSQAKQIGNAVPPLFAEKLFTAIFKQHQALLDASEYTLQPGIKMLSAQTNRL